MAETKYLLPEDAIPERWYNIQADLPNPLSPSFIPEPGSRSARTTWRRSSRWS